MSASPLKEGGTGFKDYIDESCWTPLDHSFVYSDNFTSVSVSEFNYGFVSTLTDDVLQYYSVDAFAGLHKFEDTRGERGVEL